MDDGNTSGQASWSGGAQNVALPNVETMLKMSLQNMGQLIKTIASQFPAQSPTLSSLSIAYSTTGGTTISTKTVGGYLMAVEITTPSSTSTTYGSIYDANAPANVGSSNLMGTIQSSVGRVIYEGGYPYKNGLTIQPSSVQVVSVYYI